MQGLSEEYDMKDKTQRKLNCSAARNLNRREFLFSLGSSIGAIAFSNLLVQNGVFAEPANPLAAKPQMIPAKAKSCIFLMMEGGPSHLDTFDPKPKLHEFHMKTFDRSGKEFSAMSSGNRYYVESPFSTSIHRNTSATTISVEVLICFRSLTSLIKQSIPTMMN